MLQDWYALINLYGGPDSQINIRSTDFAAYSHRDALWVFQHYSYSRSHFPPLLNSTISFISGLTSSLVTAQPQTCFGAYINYVDPLLSANEANRLYFGHKIHARLKSLKKELDASEVFWNPQSIRP